MSEHVNPYEFGRDEQLTTTNIALAARMAMYALRGDRYEDTHSVRFWDIHRPTHTYRVMLTTSQQGRMIDFLPSCPEEYPLPIVGLEEDDIDDSRVVMHSTPYGFLPDYVYGRDDKFYSFSNYYFFTLDGKASNYCEIGSLDDPEEIKKIERLQNVPKVSFTPSYRDSQALKLEPGDYEKLNTLLTRTDNGEFKRK